MPGGKSGHGLGRKGALADGAACGKGGVDSMPGAAPFAGPKTPKADYMMLGAVIEDEKGSVFLKMTGPAKSVEAVKAAFKKLAESPFAK